MILTKEILEKGKSSKGAWNAKQLKLLGLDIHKLWKGWQRHIIGREIKEEDIKSFISLKDSHLSAFELMHMNEPKKKNKFSYTEENKKTINEAKANLVLGLKKIDLEDNFIETKKTKTTDCTNRTEKKSGKF